MKCFLYSRKILASTTWCLAIAIITVLGCKKDEQVGFKTDLALNARIVRLSDSAATTRIQVYAEDNWEVTSEANDWATLNKTSGSGNSDFLVTVTSNKGKLPRALQFYVKSKGHVDTVYLQQRGLAATINIVDANLNAVAGAGRLKTILATNIPFDQIKQEAVYQTEGHSGWLTDIAFERDNILLNAAANTSAQPRQVLLRLSYLDALGSTIKDSILITQSPVGEYQNAELKDFSYVKSLAAGQVTQDIYVEGVVLVDKGNPNIALNANSAANKHIIDKTENAITVYIQSLDGRSGLRLRMKTPGDHIFSKNEKIKLWLKNTTISKTNNPATTTINNIPSINVMEKVESSAPLVAREVYMGDLTDNDVYTFIKLKEVEISVSNGSYYNINEGYEFRMDCYPTNIRDVQGNSMYLLTNSGVSYRRNGVQVPRGSGTISGVVVHETMSRYGGNIGKYAIRHMAQSDIQLNVDRNQGFSNVLLEWDRFRSELLTGATLVENPLTPSIGSGKLSHSEFADLNYSTTTGIYGSNDHNGLIPESTGAKGSVVNGSFAARGWWNTSKSRGGALIIQSSTAGIAKPISLQIEGQVAIGGPREWIVEWSTTNDMDGGTWNRVADFTFQDMVNWTSTLLTQGSGFKVMNFNLPSSALGHPNIYIRIMAKNRNAGSTTSDTGGAYNVAASAYFGHISLKYNK